MTTNSSQKLVVSKSLTKKVKGKNTKVAKVSKALKKAKLTKSIATQKQLVLPHGVIQKKFKQLVNSENQTQKISVRKNVEFFLTGALEYIIVRLIDDSVALMESSSQLKPHFIFEVLKPAQITSISDIKNFQENELYESLGSYTGHLEYMNEFLSTNKDYKDPTSWKTYIERIYKSKVNKKKTFSNQTKLLINHLVNMLFERFVNQSRVNLKMNNVKTIDARNIEACIRGAFSPSFSDKVITYANQFRV